ncbi:hypothetical protein [Vagococcus xieshaowenii]|uniref:YolD-like protein n=1 Tax=Vagococcus xieshaowenii TaxID=2562451 RepID=A0ABX5TIU8_9ENTE|nr:hypothetical protein [Vagococcus xieshaowenii]QCA29661.1 hypothetical protein E4Z98_09750 [Vagococcus xieshaowenii]
MSDHTAKLSSDKLNNQEIDTPKERMTAQDIDNTLFYAYTKGMTVSIQLDEKDINGYYNPDIEGTITGFSDDQLLLYNQSIKISLIRHVDLLSTSKWSKL